jgi:hypothetical protein
VLHSGHIGEIEDDNLNPILRETEDGIDRKGYFDEVLLKDIPTHYFESVRISLFGVELGGRLRVIAIVALPQLT